MNFRSKKLLRAAKDAPCMYCGYRAGVVAAHVNSVALGKGMGIKAHDCYIAFLCQACHGLYDGRIGAFTKDEKEAMWMKAFLNTVKYWFENGIVTVK